jgi:4-cresol dehydrogenase (hydroxylating)
VTKLTLQLDPSPHFSQFSAVYLNNTDALARCIDALRDLLQRSAGRVQLEFMNDYRFLAQRRQFPYDTFDGSAPLPRTWIGEHLGLPARPQWIAGLTAWADCEHELALRRSTLDAALEGTGSADYADIATVAASPDPDFEGLRCAYWRKRAPMPADPDPDRDRCGVLWLAPNLPMRGDDTTQLVTQVEQQMLAHGFEPAISLRTIGGRSIRAIIGILFDRDDAGADARAIACWTALRSHLRALQVDQYRYGLLDSPPEWDAGTERLLTALKAAADPRGILAPGRYGLK